MSIACIQTHTPELEKKYNQLLASGLSEKTSAITVALEEYKQLFDELNTLKESANQPSTDFKEITTLTNLQKIEDSYSKQIEELNDKLSKEPATIKQKLTLEQQKAKELSEVKPIIVRERVETPSTFETVKDTKEEERLSAKKQKIEDSISKLEDGATSENRTKVVVYYQDVAKGVEFNLIDGVWQTMPASTKKGQKVKPTEAGAKDLQKIEEKLKENPNIAKIEKLKEQLAEVEQQIENIPTVEREVKQESTFTETEVENTAEINRINAKYEKLSKEEATPQEPVSQEDSVQQQKDKINKEYDQKIQKLKNPPVDNNKAIEDYKNRIEKMLAKGYYSLERIGKNYEDLKDLEPTQAEIEEYRNLSEGERYDELGKKLSDWKLLDSATDGEGNSIADLVKIIKQLETPQKEVDTKVELTEEEITTQLSDEIESSGLKYDPTLLQNVLGTVTVKNVSDNNTYRFSHVKMSYIVEQLDKPYTVKRAGKVKEVKLDDLQPNDVVYVDDIAITFLAGGVIEMKQVDFQTRQQVLNMYIRATKTVSWSYVDVYSVAGGMEIKMPSQFTENIVPEEIYNQQEGDTLTLHIEDDDNYNESKGDSVEQLKIYVKDSKGNNLSVLKAGKSDGAANTEFLELRQVAYDRWAAANKPKNLDLGIKVGIDNIFFGAAELVMSNGQPINAKITPQAIDKVIEAKGYILNGEFILDREIKDVNKTFVGRISKNNKDMKIPVVVFRKGVHMVAFPINMVKTANPLTETFNGIMNSSNSPQEAVNKLNEEIQNNSLDIPKLTYSDINNVEKMKAVQEAFDNNTSFVTAETLANTKYKKESLATDAEIAIDLDDLDRAISSPKIRIDLESLNLGKTLDVLENSALDLAKNINDFANELYSHIQKAPVGILETMEGTKDINTFVNIIEDEANKTREGEMQLEGMLAYDKAINVLEKAIPFIPNLKKAAKEYIGKSRLEKAKNYVEKYRNLQAQIRVSKKDKNSGINAVKC